MPTLTIRDLDPVLYSRVINSRHGRSLSETAADLIGIALDHLDARSAGAAARNASMTPAERSASAKRAVMARIAKHQGRS